MNRLKLIHAALFTPISRGRWGLPLLFRGPPGGGKTTTFRSVAKSSGLPLEILSPAERGEGAFGVVPVPVVDKHGATVLSYPPPDWTAKMPVRGLVVLDEMSSAPPALQAPLLGFLQERVVGGMTLPAGVRVMGTANRTEEAAGGWDLAMPVANRLGHLTWNPPTESEWCEALLSGAFDEVGEDGKVDPAQEEARVLEAWPDAWAKARGTVAGFLRKRTLLMKPPDPASPEASAAWPSPRSWENATRALAATAVHHLGVVERDALVGAFVGEGAASEFLAWVEANDLPDPADILDGKVLWKPDRRRLDIVDAVLGSITALAIGDKGKSRATRGEKVWEIFAGLIDDAADIIEPHMRAMVTANMVTYAPIKGKLPNHIAVLAKSGKVYDLFDKATKESK